MKVGLLTNEIPPIVYGGVATWILNFLDMFQDNDDVEIIAINFAETRSEVDEFVNKYHLEFPILLDKYGDVSQDYRVRNLPVTYFISPDGIIMDLVLGGITQKLIETKLKQLD
jgi:peroxiredoxin